MARFSLFLLAIVTITLKLTGAVTWPWLWVLLPLWIVPAMVVGMVVLVVAILVLALVVALPFAILDELR